MGVKKKGRVVQGEEGGQLMVTAATSPRARRHAANEGL